VPIATKDVLANINGHFHGAWEQVGINVENEWVGYVAGSTEMNICGEFTSMAWHGMAKRVRLHK
jgi:hypothetical protein